MPCVDFPISLPALPAFLIGAPLIPNVPLPIGADFCCHFEVDAPGVRAAIAAANALIGGAFAAGSAGLMMIISGMNEAILQGQNVIDEIRAQLPECPLDSTSASL